MNSVGQDHGNTKYKLVWPADDKQKSLPHCAISADKRVWSIGRDQARCMFWATAAFPWIRALCLTELANAAGARTLPAGDGMPVTEPVGFYAGSDLIRSGPVWLRMLKNSK
jgi:hypothetical protein